MGIGFFGGAGGAGGPGGIRKVADAAARTALTPTPGDFVVQLDTNDVWYYNTSNAWELFIEDLDNDDIAQVIADLAAHLADTTGAHAASAISFSPAGSIVANTVQAAIEEASNESLAAAADAQTTANTAVTNAATAQTTANQGVTDAAAAQADADAAQTTANTAVTNAATAQTTANTANTDLAAHIGDTTDAHDASAISFDNTTSGLTATEVQAAINEVAARKMMVPVLVSQSSGTFTPANNRRQIQQVAGNGGATTVTNILNTNATAGDELTILGTDDTNTVTYDSGTNVSLNGSVTLGLDDSLSLIYVGTQWKEVGRNA